MNNIVQPHIVYDGVAVYTKRGCDPGYADIPAGSKSLLEEGIGDDLSGMPTLPSPL